MTTPRQRDANGRFAPRADSAPPHGVDVEAIRRADSTVVNALTLSGRAGVDKGASLTVEYFEVNREQRSIAMAQIGLMYRAITMLPTDAVRAGWTVKRGENKDVTAQLDRDLGIPDKVQSAATLARWGGAALIVLWPGDDLARMQLPRRPGEPVAALTVYEEPEISPLTWDSDPLSPDYREPSTWQITPLDGQSIPYVVHSSRVVYFCGAKMPYWIRRSRPDLRWLDASMVSLYWDAITRHDSMGTAALALAEALDIAVMKIPGLIGILAGPAQQSAAAKARYQAFARQSGRNGLGLLDKDDEFQRNALSAAGFADLSMQVRRDVSAVENIPQQKFFGDTPSGLNTDGESALSQYDACVEAYRAANLRKQLDRLYSTLLDATDVEVVFHPPRPMTLTERVDIETKLTDRALKLVSAGLVTVEQEIARMAMDEPSVEYAVDDEAGGFLLADPEDGDPAVVVEPATPTDPAAPPPAGGDVVAPTATAPSGILVGHGLAIVDKVRLGEWDAATAIESLVSFVGLSEEAARRLVDTVTPKPPAEPVIAPGADDAAPPMPPGGGEE